MVIEQNIEHMDAQALRELALSLMTRIESQNRELVYRQTVVCQGSCHVAHAAIFSDSFV